MRKRCLLGLLALLFAATAVFGAETTVLNFEGAPGEKPSSITVDWLNNRSKNFEPYGTAELIDKERGAFKKALQLTSAGTNVEVYTVREFPATTDSRFQFRVLFTGKGELRPGFYGYDENGRMSEYQTNRLAVDSPNWDQRQFFFSIRKPATRTIRPFVSVGKDNSMVYGELSITKLDEDEQYLLPSHNLALWHERTKGTNLIRGKKVAFDPQPNYTYTKQGGTDETDLTDGRFNEMRDQLWFAPEAVAWFNAFNGLNIIADLESVQPVQKVVIRICGGRLPPNNIKFPREIQAYVSKDGKNYHRAAALIKLNPAEYELSNWKTHYYLKESDDLSGIPYVYPFELQIQADARYVVVRTPFTDNWVTMACDEMAVMREEHPEQNSAFNAAYQNAPEDLFHKELRIRPRMDAFYVADNMDIPNFFIIDDRNPDKKGAITYTVDLPEAIAYTDDTASYPRAVRTYTETKSADGRSVHAFMTTYPYERFISMVKSFKLGPFYFRAPAGAAIPEKEMYAEFTTYIDGNRHSVTRLPLKLISIPEVAHQSRQFCSLIDARTDYELGWPNFLDNIRRLGMGEVLLLMPNSMKNPKAHELYASAKQAGFRIRHFTVPTLMITNKYREEPEYRCIGMPKNMFGFCPSYRGKYYQEILEMITETVKAMPPDYITFEDEVWQPAQMNHSLDCERCQAYCREKGMKPLEFMRWVQADFLSHYKEAVIKGLEGNPYPPNGHYVFNPFAPGYSCRLGPVPHLGGWDLFPKYTDQLHMSYYGRNPMELQKMMRTAFSSLKNPKQMVPFLTGGSGSYCESAMYDATEKLVMEAFMNGACGFELYAFHSLESPLDYSYLAQAMKNLMPYEDFLMKAELAEIPSSNPKLALTARSLDKGMLLLVGNYGALESAETILTLPAAPARVMDAVTGQPIPAAQQLKLQVAPNAYRFVHAEF